MDKVPSVKGRQRATDAEHLAIPSMTYEEYKHLRQTGQVVAGLDTSAALRLVDYLPKHYQYAHIFWSWVWLLSVPAFICVSIFFKWWVGLLLLFFVTPIIFRATRKSAAEFVLEHAEEDEQFFNELVRQNVLVFKRTNA
jgi:hypothetical protein